jgi:hypothetical protein
MRPPNSARLKLEELNARLNPGTLSYINYVVSYTAGGGETNVVGITGATGGVNVSDTGVTTIVADASAAPFTTGSGNFVTFSGTVFGVDVETGDLGDSVSAAAFPISLSIEGGGGDGTLTGGAADDVKGVAGKSLATFQGKHTAPKEGFVVKPGAK